MKTEELVPKPSAKVLFKLASFKTVPAKNGCYVLATFDDRILYIGLATDLTARFKQHLDNPEKINPTDEGKAVWFYFTYFDGKNLPKLERTWINQFTSKMGRLPILNKVNSPVT